jgi:MFS transporter, DHA1 family, tetracycline resistance protein
MTQAQPAPTRAGVYFILGVVVLDMLAIGLIVPVMVPLVQRYFEGDTQAAAHAFGIVLTLWALLQFVMSPILGALSDQYGRRPIILLSCIGLGLSFFATALAPTFALFVASRMISGATAGNISAANAYIADVTAPQDRAKAFGLLGAAFGVGFSLGPALGGLLGSIDIHLPFYVAGTLALLNAAYGWFILPESLKPENRTKFSWRKANPIGSLLVFRGQPMLYALLPVYALFCLAQNVFPSSFVLYAQHRYHFDIQTIGLTMAASAILGILAQALFVQRAVKAFGERRALLIGLAAGATGFAFYGLAPTALWFWASMPIMMIWALFMPSIQSLMTQRVSPSAQGRLQGGLGSLMALSGVAAPSLFTGLFAWGIGGNIAGIALPGAPFLAAAGFLALAMIVAAVAISPTPAPEASASKAQ